MSGDGTRIVLVKPGDVLIIGNATAYSADAADLLEPLTALKERLGLAQLLVFEDDIDLAVQQNVGR